MISDEEIKKAKELRAQGLTYTEIGKKLGYSQTYIGRKISDGKLSKKYLNARKSLSEEEECDVVERTLQGESRASIARHYGISDSTVRNTLIRRDNFIPIKNRTKSKDELKKEEESYQRLVDIFIDKTDLITQDKICEEYKDGKSQKKICKENKIHNGVLKRFLIRKDVEIRSFEESINSVPKNIYQIICDRYIKGESSTKIGDSLGYSGETITNVLKNSGVKIRGTQILVRLFPFYKIICKRYDDGESLNQIAKDFEVTATAIRNILKRENKQIRTSEEQCRAIELDQWETVCSMYKQGKGLETIANYFGVATNVIQLILKKNNIEIRTLFYLTQKWDYGLEENIAIKLCEKYKAGASTRSLEKEFGVEQTAILRTLRKNNYEVRSQGNLGDSVQHALNRTGLYKLDRETTYYIFTLIGYPKHLKPGITVDVSDRSEKRWYKDSQFEKIFPNRQSAYFVEQSVLKATYQYWDCPDEIQKDFKWGGRDEVRLMDLDELIGIFDFYYEEYEVMGTWEFAANYVEMTEAEKDECLRRSKSN